MVLIRNNYYVWQMSFEKLLEQYVFHILILRRKFVEILVTEIIRIFHSGLSFMFCPLVLLWQLYSIVFLSQSYQGLLSLYFQGPLSLSGKLESLIVRLISVTSVTFSVFLSLFHCLLVLGPFCVALGSPRPVGVSLSFLCTFVLAVSLRVRYFFVASFAG